ncbi:hypothetical protein DL95DRAFT_501718 [Leptodontidium sp. 2 PMI_412]|nr:hypothetical protein DL95DRAFT_501718 [Leptodontidium sp. 2 PMI_412]
MAAEGDGREAGQNVSRDASPVSSEGIEDCWDQNYDPIAESNEPFSHISEDIDIESKAAVNHYDECARDSCAESCCGYEEDEEETDSESDSGDEGINQDKNLEKGGESEVDSELDIESKANPNFHPELKGGRICGAETEKAGDPPPRCTRWFICDGCILGCHQHQLHRPAGRPFMCRLQGSQDFLFISY